VEPRLIALMIVKGKRERFSETNKAILFQFN
jgi:hypothetical protein